MSKLLESFAFLSEEEKRLKVKVEQTLQNIDNSYENFKEIFAKHEVARYDYFRDLRADIDTRRHELIEQVHNLSDALIDRLKKIENDYNSQVNETVGSKSLDFKIENEIEKLHETLRSPSLTVTQMRDKETSDMQTLNDLNEDILRLEEFMQDMRENKFIVNAKYKLDSSQIGHLKLKAPRGRIVSNKAVKIPDAPKLESKTETPSLQFSFKPFATTTPTPTSSILAAPVVKNLDATTNVKSNPKH
jgi:chromosome segregation ATPase